MVTESIKLTQQPNSYEQDTSVEEEIVKTNYWELPISSLDGWRPFTANLHYSLFYGPAVEGGHHGLDLHKDLVGYCHGHRGATKTLTMSYFLGKKMVSGAPVWTNYPISFYMVCHDDFRFMGKEDREFIQVGPCKWVNRDNTLAYFESMQLDMDKYYSFSKEIRNGAVGIDELQYFVESRTSGKYQNRVMGYQLMQIRKTANSFYYTVQDPSWVDKRFGWSADFEIECADISKMNYDMRSTDGHRIQEGEKTRWIIRDISGVLTGVQYKKNQRDIGPYQFDGWNFWNIYPTHFIIDIFEAMAGPDKDKKKKDLESQQVIAIEEVLNELLDQGIYEIVAAEVWAMVQAKGVDISPVKGGQILSGLGITKHQNSKGKWIYELKSLIEGSKP